MEALNIQLSPFFQWLLKTSLQGSLLICLIFLVKSVLRGKLPVRWHYYLWLLLLVRLALPWAPQSRLSIFNLIPQYSSPEPAATALTTKSTGDTEQTIVEHQTVQPKPATAESRLTSTSAPVVPEAISPDRSDSNRPVSVGIVRILPLAWFVGAIALGGYVAVRNFNLWRTIKRERPIIDSEILELLEDCKMQMNVQTIVGVIVTDRVKSPALFGFIRPRLLLPQGLIEALDFEELHYVFLHELAHLKRRDIYLGWLVSLLQVMHWFNPLIWFALRRMRTDQELACDGLALSTMNIDESPKYGRTIVNLFEQFSQVSYMPSIAGILEEPSQLERRIKMIAKFKNDSRQSSPLAVILIIILACVSLPDAKRTKASETSAGESAHQPKFTKIWIPTKPGNGVLSPDGKKLAFVSEGSIWVAPVHGKVSPDIAGEPIRLPGTEKAWHWCMSWSADGAWIAYGNPGEICIVPSSGGKVRRSSVEVRGGNNVFDCRLSMSRDGRTVAYSSEVEDKMQIFTADVESGDFKQLTEDVGKQPCFSPDGKKIAFVKPKPQKKASPKSDIWVIPATGGEPIQVSNLPGRATGPVWSPDGKRIAFTRKTGGDDMSKEICIVPVPESGKPAATPTQIELPLETWRHLAGWTPDNEIGVLLSNPEHQAIYTVPASGGNATQVTPQGYTFHPRWSPDGERIYFRWNGGNIASVPSEGGEISTVPLDTDSKIFVALPGAGNAVSPDGKKITFSGAKEVLEGEKRRYEVDIYTIPIEGGEPKKLTKSPGQDRFPCWSPDGNSIAFVRYGEPSKGMSICIVPTEGGEVRQLTSESHRVKWSTIAWSPDGKLMAYFSGKNISVIPIEGGEPRVVVKVADVSDHSELAWSPDGSKLAYSSKGSIWAVSLDGGEPEEIKTGLDAKASHISWSPDGEKMAFSAIRDGDVELWLMENLLPGTPVAKPEPSVSLRRIKTGPMSDFSSPPSLDGRYLCDLGSRDAEGYSPLAVRDLVTGEVRPLTEASRAFPRCPVISPESKYVAYVHQSWFPPKSELQLIKMDGTGHRVLYCLEQDEKFHIRAWTPDGKKILGAFKKGSESLQLVTFTIEDGSIQVIYTFDTYWPVWRSPLHKVAISPDGRYIAYDRPPEKGSWNSEIYILDIEHQRAACVVQHPAYDKLLGWTPDGKYIFFSSDRRQGLPRGFTATNTRDAYLLSVAEGKTQGPPVLIKSDIPDKLRPKGFTSSGTYHYTVEFKSIETAVAKLDLQTGKLLTKPQAVGQTGAGQIPTWSPDGRHLAYGVHQPDQSQTIRIRDIETGGEHELDPNLPHFSWLRWSPDGKSFLVSNFAKNSPRVIYRINADTGERLTMVQSESSDTLPGEPQLSLDGSILYYVLHHSDSKKASLITRDIESGHEEELFALDGIRAIRGLTFALSPDGRKLALATQRGASSGVGMDNRILIMPAKGGEPRELWKTEGRATMPIVAWTPDGQALLFTKRIPEGGRELWLVPTGAGQARKLCSAQEMMCQGMMYGAVFSVLDVHPDGRRIAFDCFEYRHEVWAMENFLPKAVASVQK